MPDYNAINKLQQQVLQTNVAPTPFNVAPPVSYEEAGAGRYPNFFIGLDNEDIYGQNQSTLDKWKNAAIKFGATASSTFIQGTAGLINGVAQWANDGQFSSFYDNDFNRGLNNITQGLENTAPNYYTAQERNASWYSPKTWATANFWADSVFKNAGFALGAYASGAAWSKLAGSAVSAISKGFAEGEGTFIAENLTGSNNMTDLATRLTQTANTANKLQKVIDFGKNATRAGIATFGEASIEALNARDQYKKELIDQYRNRNGFEPTEEALAHISDISDELGNGVFAANTALLSVTNYIQFPKLSGLLWKDARRTAATELVGAIEQTGNNVLNQTLKAVDRTPTKIGRILNNVKGFGRAFFSPSEAFEEGAQYALPIGIKDYINKGESDQPRDIMSSLGEGIRRTLTDREGQLSILIGGLSGGIMETGGRLRRGEGLLAGRFEENTLNNNTQQFLQAANQYTSNSYISDGVKYMNRTQKSLEDTQQAVLNNDRLAFEDGNTDSTLSYLIPRIQYGRMDLVRDDIQGYRDLTSTADGWNQLIDNGIVTQETDKGEFLSNLDSMQQTSENLNTQFEFLKTKYPDLNPKVIGYMAYTGAKIDDYNKRIQQLIPQVGNIDINSYITKVNNGTITEDDFLALNEQIEQSTQGLNPEQADLVRESARDILELTARRNLKIDEYKQLKDNPDEYIPQENDVISQAPEQEVTTEQVEPYRGDLNDSQYQNFTNNGVVEDQVLQGIADKVFQNLPLTERETEVFNVKTDDINRFYDQQVQQATNQNLNLIESYRTEAIQRQQEVQNSIEQRKNELQNIQNELKIEQWNAEELVSRKKGWFPKFVNSIQALTELRDEEQTALDNLNQENIQLTGYIQELQNIIDNPPTNLIKLQDNLRNQQSELENLILDNGNSINTLSSIIEKTQNLINRLKDIIQDKLRLFTTRNNSPLAETAILTLDQDTPNIDVLRQVQDIENFEIAPATRREQQTIGEIQDLYNQIDEYSRQIQAKQQVLERIERDMFPILNPVSDEKVLEEVTVTPEVNTQEQSTEEDGIPQETNNQIPDEPIVPKYDRNQDKKETSDQDLKKPLPILFQSTVIPDSKEATWYKKFENYTKNFRFLTSRQKANSRVLYVTANNEEDLGLKGLTESTTGGFFADNDISITDIDQGRILSVIIEIDPEIGQHFFLDQKGNRLTEVGKQADITKVVSAPMANTSDEWENYKGQRYADRPGYKIEDEISKYRTRRQAIFNGEYDNKPITFQVSRGKEDKNITQKHNVVGRLISPDQVAQVGLLQIKGSREINNVAGEPIKGLLPTDVLIDNGDAIEKVYSNNVDTSNIANLFTSLDKRADQRIVDYLQGVFYMKEGLNWINLDTKTVTLNGKDYKLSDRNGIEEALKDQPHNINRDLLNSKESFTEMIADQDGNLTESPFQNYQAYLISPKNVQGENRTAPVYTFVRGFSDKYIVLQDEQTETKQEDNQPIVPEIERTPTPIINTKEPTTQVYFLQPPSDGVFRADGRVNNQVDGLYEISFKNSDPTQGEYRFIDTLENVSLGIQNEAAWIKTGFDRGNAPMDTTTSIRTDAPGIVVLRNGNWEIVKKGKITYLDEPDTRISPNGLPEINLCI